MPPPSSALQRPKRQVADCQWDPEIGATASKTFTTQLVAMQLLGLYLAQV
jgi:glucosamine 6-phosphate synthetase-like amidotransferase/phosphosugar isomerase protein